MVALVALVSLAIAMPVAFTKMQSQVEQLERVLKERIQVINNSLSDKIETQSAQIMQLAEDMEVAAVQGRHSCHTHSC